jgi:hypothetical protein
MKFDRIYTGNLAGTGNALNNVTAPIDRPRQAARRMTNQLSGSHRHI